jgi:hypothetical protein
MWDVEETAVDFNSTAFMKLMVSKEKADIVVIRSPNGMKPPTWSWCIKEVQEEFSFYNLNLNLGFKPVDWCRDALNIISKSDVELAGPHISKTSTLGIGSYDSYWDLHSREAAKS